MNTLRILCIGDVSGKAGRVVVEQYIDRIRKQYAIDCVVLNGENSAHGRGITPAIAQEFKSYGVSMITTGNHIWHNKEIYRYLDEHDDVLRPINFSSETPGKGVGFFNFHGITVAVINVQGRVFMREHIACPFKAMDSVLTYVKSKTSVILVDFHAEATSEKHALAYYLDGRVSAVFGTHTHVQTADERVLPNGTAYITDLGMCGSLNEAIGMKKEPVIRGFLTQMPSKFEVATSSPLVLCGAVITIDTATGKAASIERVRILDESISIDGD